MPKVRALGFQELQARLTALDNAAGRKRMLGELAGIAVARAQDNLNPHRKTGNAQRNIRIIDLTDTTATVGALFDYAVALEEGSQPHTIAPRRRRALRFAATSGGARLSGSARRGADVVFARRVSHPGTQPVPFLRPAVLQTARLAPGVLKTWVIDTWNRAA